MKCIERCAALLECATETEWLETLLRLGSEHGYEKTLLAVVPDRVTLLENAFVRSNYRRNGAAPMTARNFSTLTPSWPTASCAQLP